MGKFKKQTLQWRIRHNIKDDDVYEVEHILDSRLRNGQAEYLIKWAHYGAKWNNWEPDKNILDRGLVAAFENSEPAPASAG